MTLNRDGYYEIKSRSQAGQLFKNNMAEVIRNSNKNRGTMILTRNGEAKAALMDIKAYEDLQETLAMLEMIAQGNKDLTEGRYRQLSKC